MAGGRAGVAIVTGSDSGIGKATAVALAEAGFDVGVTWHTDEAGATGTAEEIAAQGRKSEFARLDLGDLPDAAAEPFVDLGFDEWRHVLAVDLDGPLLCGQRAAPRMIAAGTGGRIINVTSVHEHLPLPGSSAYCAAKGGLGLLTKVMALELAEHGILVNAVAPGEISTPMTGQHDVDPRTEVRPGIPLKRPGSAHEVAAAIVHLAGPGATYTTGASFVVDGGLLLMAAVRNS